MLIDNVLVVDNEREIVEIISGMIIKLGIVSLRAYSAREAMDIFHNMNPGIIITDLKLGGDMDGIALCSKILYEDNSVIVMAMSGHFNEYDKAYCQGVGFTEALTKPVELSQLSNAIECAVDRRARWAKISGKY